MYKFLLAVLVMAATTYAYAASCGYADCHSDIISQKTVHPAADGGCLDCHTAEDPQIEKHQEDPDSFKEFKFPVSEDEVLCFACHEDNKTNRKYVHGPVASGDCVQCHNPHASDNSFMLKNDTVNLCKTCHSEMNNVSQFKHQHQPVNDDCTACHDPHGSDHEMFLKKEMTQMCSDCHSDLGERISTLEYVHAPVDSDGCSACHSVHGSDNPYILYEYFPQTFYNDYKKGLYALCFQCHDEERLSATASEDITGFRNGSVNLHNVHVTLEKKGRSCKSCHEVHASAQPLHIRKKVPFGTGGWELPIKYTKTDNGGSCNVGCHKPKAYDRANPVVNK